MEENMANGKEKADQDRKTKNLISIIILLLGLFLGSLFIDTAQLIQKSGFSTKNLNRSDIFEASGRTWVAYSEPIVGVQVINDDSCEKCNVDEVLVWLRRVLPTVSTQKVDYQSAMGKQLIDEFGIKTLPAFVFDGAIAQTDFYSQANTLFNQKNGQYAMLTQEIGIPVGEYIVTPQINEGDAVAGNKDAEVKVVVYSDFQCPYCKLFHTVLDQAIKDYGDRVAFDYKFLPLDIHPQANDAALAAACALDQGKFWEYADKLYANQTDWGKTGDIAKLKSYAVALKLDAVKFNRCLDSKQHQDLIDADKKEADSFAISGTPGVFVNNDFQDGAVSYEQLKQSIDQQLAK